MKDKKVGVLMGGMSSEREISLKTGEAIVSSLKRLGYQTVAIDVDQNICQKLLKERVDVAFIALHGRYGEDGAIQGLLEIMNIPYTGSGVAASAMAMDKIVAKSLFKSEGILTPDYIALTEEEVASFCRSLESGESLPFDFPVVVKPSSEGSTIGVRIVRDRGDMKEAVEEAKSYSPTIFVEKYVKGAEITVGVIEGETVPTIEIVPRSHFYDYTAKYTKGMTEYRLTTSLDEATDRQVHEIALRAYRVLGCRGAARVDLIVDTDMTPWILEVNTIPGMTETSLLPKAAESVGISFDVLVERMLKGARCGV
jgi:D-alanine-D-alanine ligase